MRYIDGNNGCFFTYARATNTLYLKRDSDGVWQPLVGGSSGSVSNPNCSIAGPGTTVSTSGNVLTLNVALSFTPNFGGAKNFYVSVSDTSNSSSGWVNVGSWTPTSGAAIPTVTALTPSSGSGNSQLFELTLSDANGQADIAGFVAIINNTINGNNSCFFTYSRAANTLYLLRDSDRVWQPLTPGSSTSVSNLNCSIAGTGFTISTSGNSLIVRLPISFLPAFSGSKNFYVSVSDTGNLSSGWVTAGTWSPGGSPAAPSVKSLAPASGQGVSQTFALTVSDANGNADISGVVVIINSAINGNNACFFAFSRSANALYLLRDSDGAWQPLSPGSGSSVSNPNCSIAGTGFSVTAAGNDLTLNLPITFTAAFSGTRNLYVSASDAGDLSSGWVTAGTWTVGGTPATPNIASWTPNSGSGSSRTFTLTLSDGNGYADIDGVVTIINSAINGTNGCFFSYGRKDNKLFLFRDSDNSWQPLVPGTSSSVSNANCTISGTGFVVTPSGNTVTITLPISFTSAFAGVRNIYSSVSDNGGLSSGWVTAGTWTIP